MSLLSINILSKLRKIRYSLMHQLYSPGSNGWLISTEMKYGGFITDVPRNRVSDHDPRTPDEISAGGMTGGDRMLHHGYAPWYSQYLKPFLDSGKSVTLAEIGILKGTGLAIWCDLFPRGRIIGLDIDLSHTTNNIENLLAAGAFKHNKPELHEFDQFADNEHLLGEILHGTKIDICIDDGFHSEESIMATLNSVLPHMSDQFVYIIEDNSSVADVLRLNYPDLLVLGEGELTILSPRQPT